MDRWLADVSPAAWIADRLHPFAQDAGSVVPDGFEAYGRLFHPVGRERARWGDIARRNGKIAHSEMQLHLIGADHVEDASWGSLPGEERQVLVDVLRSHTTTPARCWFAVWEGYGGLDDGGVTARLELPGRSYLLAEGPLESAAQPVSGGPVDQSFNLWWPDDRAWFVATEIDLAWTYVGGVRRLVDNLLVDDRLEVLEARITHRMSYDGDVLNADPPSLS